MYGSSGVHRNGRLCCLCSLLGLPVMELCIVEFASMMGILIEKLLSRLWDV